MQIYAFCVMSW